MPLSKETRGTLIIGLIAFASMILMSLLSLIIGPCAAVSIVGGALLLSIIVTCLILIIDCLRKGV